MNMVLGSRDLGFLRKIRCTGCKGLGFFSGRKVLGL